LFRPQLLLGYALLKLIFALLCGLVGLVIGIVVSHHLPGLNGETGIVATMRDVGLPIVIGLIFVALSPWVVELFQHIAHRIEDAIVKMAPGEVLSGTVGLVLGLVVAYFVQNLFQPVRQLPYFGGVIAFIIYALITLFFSYLGVRIGLRHRIGTWSDSASTSTAATAKLLDTSVIVDGRILEIAQAGFAEGQLLVPKFVLKELQTIADSSDSIKRARGRRGLEVLNRLREASGTLQIIDQDPPERDVDSKLVVVARLMNLPILTNDYNLNRVAKLQGVAVMNVNELDRKSVV